MAGKQCNLFCDMRMPQDVGHPSSHSSTANIFSPDEGRRTSSRATKGQHTKKDELLENTPEPVKKKGGKKGKKAAVEEEEVEIIRCICGATESDPDDEEPWIACDICQSWQHNVCM